MMKDKMKRKAFTISEMMVCIGVIAALTALFMSVIRIKPNSNMVMFRKAYNIVSTTMYEIFQTAAYYEGASLSDYSTPTSEVINGERPSGNTKFCKVFGHFVNTTDIPDCSTSTGPNFITTDGIAWYMPPNTTNGTFSSEEKIIVDVNGENKPNCHEGETGCKHPDKFNIYISGSGKLFVRDALAQQYLQNSRRISK